MIAGAFADWPGMKGKFPIESWILSKRDWPRCHGQVKQYYGPFRGAPASGQRYLNYNDKGNTPELQAMLEEMFPEQSRFEKSVPPPPEYDCRVRGVVIGLLNRPRWENRCIREMAAAGIDVEILHGTDAHHGDQPVMPLNRRAFRREFGREMLTGEIGCYSSHIRISKAAESLPPLCEAFPDWRLVFEDDAIPMGDIDGGKVARIAHLAAQGGYDLVMMNTGRENRRGRRSASISPATGNDPFTHAYLVNLKGAREMSRWEMRHPIDLAISKAKQMKVGLLNGMARFEQRSPADSMESIHRERKYGAVPDINDASAVPSPQIASTSVPLSPGIASPLPLPRLIHQVWIQGAENLPDAFKKNRDLWQEAFPDFKMMLWDQNSASRQWPDFEKVSDKCFHHATRADLILARAVRDFGGLATGTDCRPNNIMKLRQITNTLENFIVLTPGRPEISNGLQWSATPGHPFWKCVCNHQLRSNGEHLGRKSVSSATGPKCYHEVFSARFWQLHVITAPLAFTRDWNGGWENPNALIDPGFAASWT